MTVKRYLGSLWCWMWGGHKFIAKREPEHISLQCWNCGKETQGWYIGPDARLTRQPIVPATESLELSREEAKRLFDDMMEIEYSTMGCGG